MMFFDNSKKINVDNTGIFYPFFDEDLKIINDNELRSQIGGMNHLTISP